MKKQSMKHLATCKERSALTRQKALLNFFKKLLKSVDSLCMRCYNIQVSRESYALDEGGNMMALEALKQAEKHTVGVKQTEKAVQDKLPLSSISQVMRTRELPAG